MEAENVGRMTAGKRCGQFFGYHWRGVCLLLVPLSSAPLLLMKPVVEFRCCFVLCVMGLFWITEAMPLPVTGLFPLMLFPVMGVMSSDEVCLSYFKDALMLFFASVAMALGIEYSNLHKRIVLNVMLVVGCSPRRLHLSMMLVTTFVSMWIANSAATALMCPVIKAVLEELASQGILEMEDKEKILLEDDPPYPSRVVIAYYLGAAYSASIGGCGTLIGTGTNFVFKGIYDGRFPEADNINFTNFTLFAAPLMVVNITLTYLVLEWQFMGLFRPNSRDAQSINVGKEGEEAAKRVIESKYRDLGPISCHELQMACLFCGMVVALFLHKPGLFPGFEEIMKNVHGKSVKSSMPVVLALLLLFLLPVNYMFMKYCICSKPTTEGTTKSLMAWEFIHKRFPWGLLLLVGGGFALSDGIRVSGLATLAGNSFSVISVLPPALIQFVVIILGIVATAFTSNKAMCTIFVTVLMELSVAIKIHPTYLCLPTCIALSMAFHLPASTPPNALVAGLGHIRSKDMALAGIGPTIIVIVNIFLFSQTWCKVVFPDLGSFPDWAKP